MCRGVYLRFLALLHVMCSIIHTFIREISGMYFPNLFISQGITLILVNIHHIQTSLGSLPLIFRRLPALRGEMAFYSTVVTSDSLAECRVAWSLCRTGTASPCNCPATRGILLLEVVPLVPVPLSTGALFSMDGSPV